MPNTTINRSAIQTLLIQNYLTVSFLLAFLVGAILMLAIGINPLVGYAYIVMGGIGTPTRFSASLIRMIPLVIGGLGVIIAFQAGVFNFGGPGQALMGYYFTGFLSASLLAFTNNSLLGITLCLIGGVIGGACMGLIPAILKTELQINEIVVCIMLNYLVVLLGGYLLTIQTIQGGLVSTLFRLPFVFSHLHIGILFIGILPILVYVFLFRTVKGFQLRAVGLNPKVAKCAGMNPRKIIWMAMILSGGLLGLAGGIELLGVQFRVNGIYNASFGITSIIVALFGFSNPIFAVIIGLMLGILEQGGYFLQAFLGVPRTLIDAIEGSMVFFLLLGRYLHMKYQEDLPIKKE